VLGNIDKQSWLLGLVGTKISQVLTIHMTKYYYHGFNGKKTYRGIKKRGLSANNKTYAQKKYRDSYDNALYISDDPAVAFRWAWYKHGKSLMFIAIIPEGAITTQLYVDENFAASRWSNNVFYVKDTIITDFSIALLRDTSGGYNDLDVCSTVRLY
jgi:hypothetical protein